jgi:hypothetical protein
MHSEEDTRGVRTLQNLHGCIIKSAIFNFAAAWKEMKTTTLANGWTKLSEDTEPVNDFKSFEIRFPRNHKEGKGWC